MIYTVLDDGKTDTGVDAVAEDAGTRDIDVFLADSFPSLDVTEW